MFYQGEFWKIRRYGMGIFQSGLPCEKVMGWWLVSKITRVELKDKATGKITKIFNHYEISTVWEDNPLQPYQLVHPDGVCG